MIIVLFAEIRKILNRVLKHISNSDCSYIPFDSIFMICFSLTKAKHPLT